MKAYTARVPFKRDADTGSSGVDDVEDPVEASTNTATHKRQKTRKDKATAHGHAERAVQEQKTPDKPPLIVGMRISFYSGDGQGVVHATIHKIDCALGYLALTSLESKTPFMNPVPPFICTRSLPLSFRILLHVQPGPDVPNPAVSSRLNFGLVNLVNGTLETVTLGNQMATTVRTYLTKKAKEVPFYREFLQADMFGEGQTNLTSPQSLAAQLQLAAAVTTTFTETYPTLAKKS